MSLINKMLQDLEARRAESAGRQLPNEVRALPPQRRRRLWPVGLLPVAGLLAGAVFFLGRAEPPSPLLPPQLVVLYSGTGSDIGAKAALVPSAKLAPPLAAAPSVPSVPVQAAPNQAIGLPSPLLPAARLPEIAARPAARPDNAAVVVSKEVRAPTARERANTEYAKAITQMNQGRTEQAAAGFRLALREDPGWSPPRQALLGLLLEQKRYDEAQEMLRQTLAENEAQPEIAMQLARIQVERKDLKGAAETLQRSAAQAANNADYQALNGAVLQRLGRHRAAATAYQAALSMQPQNSLWWMGLGISLEADGNAAEARQAFIRARDSRNLTADLAAFVEQKLRVPAQSAGGTN